MNPAGMNRRLIGAVALAVGAVATAGGVLLPLYQETRTFPGQNSTLVVTAFGSTGAGASTPGFGVPLVLAALLMLVAAALVFRETPSTPLGRMTAIAGAAVLLGAAWSVYLFVTNQSAVAVVSVPPGGQLVQTLDLGLMLLGGGWVVGTLGAVLVQELPEPDTSRDEWRERAERVRETVRTSERVRVPDRGESVVPERVREEIPVPQKSRAAERTRKTPPATDAPWEDQPQPAPSGGKRRRRHALRESDEEPENDEAIIYQLPDVAVDDVATPPLGYPAAEFGPPEPESYGFPPEEFGPQGPDDEPEQQTTRVTLDPVDPPGRS